MANTTPTRFNIFYIIYLCFLAIFYPSLLVKEEEKDNISRNQFSSTSEQTHRAYYVNNAFWGSLLLIVLCTLIGGIVGWNLNISHDPTRQILIIMLQIFGASLLLWGTLFVRGWEIQTYCGVTISERVNQWIYRFMYCMGTVSLVISVIWSYKQ